MSLAHIGHLDFEGLKAIGCKGVVFDKVRNGVPNVSVTTPKKAEKHLQRRAEYSHLVSRGCLTKKIRTVVVPLPVVSIAADLIFSCPLLYNNVPSQKMIRTTL